MTLHRHGRGRQLCYLAVLCCLGGAARSVRCAQKSGPGDRRVPRETWEVWDLRVQPLAECFTDVGQVQLILTVGNIGKKIEKVMFPYPDDTQWYQWARVYYEGKRLASQADEDYVYPLSTIRPGEQLSMLVDLSKFCQKKLHGEEDSARSFYRQNLLQGGEGLYYVYWSGGAIGRAKSTHVTFMVNKRLKQTHDPSTIDFYLASKKAEALSKKERQALLWADVLGAPSNPIWLGLLRVIPRDYISADSVFRLLNSTKDVGVRREAVRALARLGRNPDIASQLEQYLRTQEDVPLLEIGRAALRLLRSNPEKEPPRARKNSGEGASAGSIRAMLLADRGSSAVPVPGTRDSIGR